MRGRDVWRENRSGRLENLYEKLAFLEGPYVPRALGMDLWKGRSAQEAVYAQVLGGMRGLVDFRTGVEVTADVLAKSIVWSSRRLNVEYRTEKKATMPFRVEKERSERRWSSEYGYVVLYHNTDVENYASLELEGRYVPLPCWWK